MHDTSALQHESTSAHLSARERRLQGGKIGGLGAYAPFLLIKLCAFI